MVVHTELRFNTDHASSVVLLLGEKQLFQDCLLGLHSSWSLLSAFTENISIWPCESVRRGKAKCANWTSLIVMCFTFVFNNNRHLLPIHFLTLLPLSAIHNNHVKIPRPFPCYKWSKSLWRSGNNARCDTFSLSSLIPMQAPPSFLSHIQQATKTQVAAWEWSYTVILWLLSPRKVAYPHEVQQLQLIKSWLIYVLPPAPLHAPLHKTEILYTI